ncbi:MAG: O-antigen ligase C-terminal domain-containing protein [Burkholderiales bacterium]|nr:O-antigen ligase C-terminal domain-containing protein [Burkholderiales bacterium]MDE2566552.1 O-antigen ligase C-terminal domain-containing protein [Burkholderiales bacterium]
MPALPIGWVIAVAVAAAAAPSLLAYNVSPSPTFLNQALAFALWAAFVMATAPVATRWAPGPVYGALALLAAAVGWSWLQALPASLALSALGTMAAAALLVAAGAGARASGRAEALFAAFCWGWVAAGVINIVIACVQVFAPGWTDGVWIATSGFPGRAVGNLRQPNHLSSLLMWSCVAVLGLLELGRLRRVAAALLLAGLVFAVVLTASRTGLVSVLLLAAWGLADRRLSRPARLLLLAAPVVYALAWAGLDLWAAHTHHPFGGAERLEQTDISSSRFAIWRDTLALIRRYPLAGVGWGEFNLAWTLTPSPHRPVAFFDHTHNLVLQFAVELGLPLAALVVGLLIWGLARGARNAWRAPAGTGVAQRCAMVMVAMIGLHSLLEYPLWYSYFLLPTAWAWGYALQGSGEAAGPQAGAGRAGPARPAPAFHFAAVLLLLGAAYSVADYARVAAIFSAAPGAPPLEQRIAAGQRSVFFAHHADYAAVTSDLPLADPAHAFDRVVHYLMDTRLMIAWAEWLDARGHVDAARDLAARLREFRKPEAAEFFAACPDAAGPIAPGRPFQCEQPRRTLDWREFLKD